VHVARIFLACFTFLKGQSSDATSSPVCERLLLERFCSRFCFVFFLDFLLCSSTFDGVLGNSGFAHFCSLFLFFANFFVFSVFESFSF